MHVTPVGEYLRARRTMVRPEDVGLDSTPNRRVVGLRRDEVATLAGISSDYYLRLEQGRDDHPSDQVLKALARALLLDDEATAFLHRLVRHLPPRDSVPVVVDPSTFVQLLRPWKNTAAVVVNGCLDVVVATDLAFALAPTVYTPGVNLVESIFDAPTRAWAPDWEGLAAEAVAALRVGSDPDDPRLHELVGGLLIGDPDFSRIWGRHDVRTFTSGTNWYHVDGFGAVDLRRQNFSIPGRPGFALITLFAEPGTLGEEALASLAIGSHARTIDAHQ